MLTRYTSPSLKKKHQKRRATKTKQRDKRPRRKRPRKVRKPAKARRTTKARKPKVALEPKLGTPEFAALQSEWYAKIQADGFEDLEWVDDKTGLGQNSDFLIRPAAHFPKVYKRETELYFQMVSNYLTWKRPMKRLDRFILSRHGAGKSYREILDDLEAKTGERRSLFFIFYNLRRIKAEVLAWNESDAEGLLNPRQTEHYVSY